MRSALLGGGAPTVAAALKDPVMGSNVVYADFPSSADIL